MDERTKEEMLAGARHLRQMRGDPPLTRLEEETWLVSFLNSEGRLIQLQDWLASGKVTELPVPPRDPDRVYPHTVVLRCGVQSTYVVNGETFKEDNPEMFPSPEFMARLILAAEFAPKAANDNGDWR